ncbi:MAG: hypothetical protein HPY45_07460 [Anaerolineae bacterium]|nr:hypothetical protein [Anaerolineae bacterium]
MLAAKIFAILLFYSLACTSLGSFVLRLLDSKSKALLQHSGAARLATAFLLGQGALANLWVLIALAGWFSPGVVIGVTTISFISGARELLCHLRGSVRTLANLWADLKIEPFGWQIIAVLSLYLALAGVTTLAAPLQGDAILYYMVLPKIVASSHYLDTFPLMGAHVNSFGLQGEMHYAALMSLGLSDAAQLFAWITGLAGAVLLCALGARLGLGRRAQWLVLAMIYTSTCVLWVMQGKTDLFTMALGIAALYWVFQDIRLGLRLAGLFCGFALVSKLSYVVSFLPAIAFLLVWQHIQMSHNEREKPFLRSWMLPLGKTLITFALWAVLAIAIHLVKNGVLLGNPFATGSDARGWGWNASVLDGFIPKRIYLTYLIELTFGSYDRYRVQLGNLSPLILGFLPLGFLLPKTRPWFSSPLVGVTLAAALGMMIWVILYPGYIEPRYLMATLLLFSLLPARAAEHISLHSGTSRLLSRGVLGCALITLVSVSLSSTTLGNHPIFFPGKTLTYLRGGLPKCHLYGGACRAQVSLNQHAKAGERVLMGIPHSYWLRSDLLQCAESLSTFADLNTGDLHWQKIYESGFKYILAEKSQLESISPPNWVHPVILFEEDNFVVYRLDYDFPFEDNHQVCRQRTTHKWDVVSK